jgi:hypothetical protein
MVRPSIAFSLQVLRDGKLLQVTPGGSAAAIRGTGRLFRQEDFHQQTVGRGVLGMDSSAVRSNHAVGDGEAEACSSGLAVARGRDAIEGSEDVGEF